MEGINEGKDENELGKNLDDIASKFWMKRGAQFGKRQKVKDIKITDNAASIPSKFDSNLMGPDIILINVTPKSKRSPKLFIHI